MEPIHDPPPRPWVPRQPATLIGPLALLAGLAVGHLVGGLVYVGWQLGPVLVDEIRTALIVGTLPEAIGLLCAILVLARGGFASRGALIWLFIKVAAALALGHYMLIILTIGLMGSENMGQWFTDSVMTFPGYILYAATIALPAAIVFALLTLRYVPPVPED